MLDLPQRISLVEYTPSRAEDTVLKPEARRPAPAIARVLTISSIQNFNLYVAEWNIQIPTNLRPQQLAR